MFTIMQTNYRRLLTKIIGNNYNLNIKAMGSLELKADRFRGFADIYDSARPTCPEKVKELILKYLGRKPSIVVDLGCGTGLSTRIWSDVINKVIGIEPSTDMINIAKEKSNYLKNVEYNKLFDKVREIELTYPNIKNSFKRWDKNSHLINIKNSGKFRYVREIVFLNSENCNAQRFISLALSQGGLQTILKAEKNEIKPLLLSFKEKIIDIFGNSEFKVEFCYRMRIGIK